MKINDFMQRLSDELQKRNVADAADILQEYEAHFAMKMADGYIEEEIAARLGDPTALVAQFDDAEETPDYDKIFLLCIFLCSQEKERHFISKEKKK